jgi:hypothetical protein
MPGTLQPYLYGLNNPVRYTDPSGRCSVEDPSDDCPPWLQFIYWVLSPFGVTGQADLCLPSNLPRQPTSQHPVATPQATSTQAHPPTMEPMPYQGQRTLTLTPTGTAQSSGNPATQTAQAQLTKKNPTTPTASPTNDPCSEERMEELVAGSSVAEVVYGSPLGDRMGGQSVKATQIYVQRVGPGSVVDYASRACRGSPFPPIDLYPGRTYKAIDDGHTRFVASRLTGIPVSESGYHRPASKFDYRNGDFVAAFEWTEVSWSN